MNRWILTLLLGGLLLSGTWSRAQQNNNRAAPPVVQAGGEAGAIEVQVGPVAASGGSGTIVVAGTAVAVPGGFPGDGQKRDITILRGPGAPVLAVPAPRPMPLPGIAMPPVRYQPGKGGVWISSARATLAGKAEKTAFLGVVTTRADATLRSQLKLKAGLVVSVVEPKTSAAAAGLQVHDIIEKCDDQWLINPAQFIGLVRMYYKPGATVTLTVIREGQRKKITAKLDERETYAVDDDGNAFYAQQGVFDPDNPEGPVSLRGWSAGGTFGPVQRITTGALGTAPLAPGFVATYGNDKGQFLITIRDGHQILTAKDAKGKQIFQGSIDTPEQRKLVPQDVGRELEEMEKIRESVKEKVRSKVHEGVQEAIRKAIEGDGPAREKPLPSED